MRNKSSKSLYLTWKQHIFDCFCLKQMTETINKFSKLLPINLLLIGKLINCCSSRCHRFLSAILSRETQNIWATKSLHLQTIPMLRFHISWFYVSVTFKEQYLWHEQHVLNVFMWHFMCWNNWNCVFCAKDVSFK